MRVNFFFIFCLIVLTGCNGANTKAGIDSEASSVGDQGSKKMAVRSYSGGEGTGEPRKNCSVGFDSVIKPKGEPRSLGTCQLHVFDGESTLKLFSTSDTWEKDIYRVEYTTSYSIPGEETTTRTQTALVSFSNTPRVLFENAIETVVLEPLTEP